jgi:protein HOOK3
LKESLAKVSTLEAERDDLAQSKFELESKLQMKEEEIEEMKQELKDKAMAFEPGTPGDVRNELHLREVDHMRQEWLKEEALKEEFRMRAEEAEQHIEELVQKNRELSSQVDNLSMLQDQLDEMRHLEEKVNRYEQMIATYKIKLEDATDIKKGMKAMEEKNTVYMQQILDLEEELRKMSSVKVQLKTYKQRIQELERNLLEERTQRKAVSHDLDIKAEEAKSLMGEVKRLEEISKTSKSAPLSSELANKEEVDFSGLPGLSPLAEALTPQMKERMVRLEKENQILKSRLDDPSSQSIEEVATLQAELEIARDRLKELESHVHTSGGGGTAGPDQTQSRQVKLLEEDIEAKAAEIEKLKKFLNKAKKIIENFGSKSNVVEESGEIHALKQQLSDKENYIQKLEKKMEENRELKEREERLIVTAWYELGMDMLQKRSEQRLLANMPFLAQQRHALFSRRGVSNQTPSSVGASPSLRTS